MLSPVKAYAGPSSSKLSKENFPQFSTCSKEFLGRKLILCFADFTRVASASASLPLISEEMVFDPQSLRING